MEPAFTVKHQKREIHFVRDGKANGDGRIAWFTLLRCPAVWASSVDDDGKRTLFLRARQNGRWTTVFTSRDGNSVLRDVVRALGAQTKGKFSANAIFAVDVDLSQWRYVVKVDGARCCSCKSAKSGDCWRYGRGYERLCKCCWRAQRRERIAGEDDEDSDEEEDGGKDFLYYYLLGHTPSFDEALFKDDELFIISGNVLRQLAKRAKCKACDNEFSLSVDHKTVTVNNHLLFLECARFFSNFSTSTQAECGCRKPFERPLLPAAVSRLFACAIVTSGLTFNGVSNLFGRSALTLPTKKTTFYKYQRESLAPWAAAERNALMDEQILSVKERAVRISLDGRWSSTRQALEGTVTCYDVDSRRILEVQHIG